MHIFTCHYLRFFVLNYAYNQTIEKIPMNVATCSTCDIYNLLRSHFWKHVYFNSDDSRFPSNVTEKICRFVGVSENVGHDMTLSILKTATNKFLVGLMLGQKIILLPLTLVLTL